MIRRTLAWTLLFVAPVLLAADTAPDDLEHNRRLLEWLRRDPEHYQRLERDLHAFQALPSSRQEAIRRLDHDLHEEDPATQAHLWRVLDRYVTWFERLAEADEQRICEAADPQERLRIVKEIRERQWIERLPAADRQRIQDAPPEKRADLMADLRRDERDKREKWQSVLHHGDDLVPARRARPVRLADFPAGVQSYVREVLQPILPPEEKQRLKNATGTWPLYARTLIELADKHPYALVGPVRYRELPDQVQQLLPLRHLTQPQKNRLANVEDKWPDFGVVFADIARNKSVHLPRPLGRCRVEDFPLGTQQLIQEKLVPELTPDEAARLAKEEGNWPQYPSLLLDLAKHHQLEVPGTRLPGPPQYWDRLRNALPDLPDPILRDFAAMELNAAERQNLQLSALDPDSRERLTKKFFELHPEALQRMLDAEKRVGKGQKKN